MTTNSTDLALMRSNVINCQSSKGPVGDIYISVRNFVKKKKP